MAERVDVAIVGGGPAGQAAALQLAGRDLRIVVIDEQARPGGQIMRQPPRAFTVARWFAGRAYADLHRQLAEFEGLPDILWRGRCSVLGIDPWPNGHRLMIADADGVAPLAADHVLLATGCQDLAVPLPGWTLPGVYTTGGIQAFLKSQQLIPGKRLLFAGTHPLQLIVAAQVVAAGGTVAAVCFAQSRAAMTAPMARAPLTLLRRFTELATLADALASLRRAGVSVRYGVGLTHVIGTDRVAGVATSAGEIACDTVGLCYGFVPQSGLPRMAGAVMRDTSACAADAWQRSSVPGLWVAGETTGVGGAAIASAEGAIAGLGIARAQGVLSDNDAAARAAPHRRSLVHRRRFAGMLYRLADPSAHLPALAADTIVCRCEDVPLSAIDGALAHARSANAVKLATRCGMGLCQGRNCEPTLLRLLAAHGIADDPGFTARFPVRPVAIGDLIRSDPS